VQAMLEQAESEEKRALSVRRANPDFVSEVELDKLKYNRISLEAQIEVAEANVVQAQAMLENSETNLEFTEPLDPNSGMGRFLGAFYQRAPLQRSQRGQQFTAQNRLHQVALQIR
jgi:hypothetical protein